MDYEKAYEKLLEMQMERHEAKKNELLKMFVEEEPSNPEESESKQAEDKEEETKDFSNSTRDYEEMDEKQLGYEDYLINEQIEGLLDLAISQAHI